MNFKKNNELFMYLISKVKEKLIALIYILAIPIVLMITLKYLFCISFSSSFDWIFGIYSLIITIILFDYIVINKEKEAKFFNEHNQINSLKNSLEFFGTHLLSSKVVHIEAWQKNYSYFYNYYRYIKDNDKIHLAKEKECFNKVHEYLLEIKSHIDLKKGKLDFNIIDKRLSADCNEEIQKLLFEINLIRKDD